MEKTIVKNDLFNISRRIKQIDKNYFLMFNFKTKKFEVHYKRNKNTLEIILPFNVLDKRTLDLVRKTRVENREKLIEEMDKNNKELELKNNVKIKDEVTFKAKEMISYIQNKGDNYNIDFSDAYKNKWS